MKRVLAILLCMILTFCAGIAARADTEMELKGKGNNVYVWEGLSIEDDITPTNDTIYCYVNNEVEMVSQYGGSPTWSFQQTGGPDVGLEMTSQSGISWYMLTATKYPQYNCSIQVEVTCTWGNQSVTQAYTADFVKVDPPQGVTIPDIVEVKAGESIDLTGAFLPAGWPVAGDKMENSMGIQGFEDCAGVRVDKTGDDSCRITGLEPGFYRGQADLSYAGVSYRHSLIVKVLDENGQLPVPEWYLDGQDEMTFSFWPGAKVGVGNVQHGEFYLDNIFQGGQIRSDEEIDSLISTVYPNWTVEVLSGPTFEMVVQEVGTRINNVQILSYPTQPGDTVLRCTCEWMDKTLSRDMTIHFQQITEPSGTNFPMDIVMESGETRTIPRECLPRGAFDGLYFNALFDYQVTLDGWLSVNWDDLNNQTQTITALKAGELTTTVFFVLGQNVGMRRNVTFHFLEAGIAASTLVLPSDVRYIQQSAFEGTHMSSVIVPNGCTAIGSRAFANCANLTSITLPDTITQIADDAFTGCGSFTIHTTDSATKVIEYAGQHGIPVVTQ